MKESLGKNKFNLGTVRHSVWRIAPVRKNGQPQGLSLHNKIPIVGTGLVPVQTDNHKGCPYNEIELHNKIYPKRKNPRLKGFDYSLPYAYFITICAFNKNKYFIKKDLNMKIIDCLISEKNRTKFLIFAYCLMPNHLHLIISPGNSGISVSKFIGGFKSKTTRLVWDNGIKKLWQDRFYDHILRKNEDLRKIAYYILNNPVRKGLVQSFEEYEYCGVIDEIPI